MREADRQKVVGHYEQRLDRHGYSTQALGWSKAGRHDLRFRVLAAPALAEPESSVLDVGCGFADLYQFLRGQGWRGRYLGIDLVPGFLEIARQRHPGIEVRQADISELADLPRKFDYVIASGIFEFQMAQQDTAQYVAAALGNMFRAAGKLACADFMTSYVDFQHPGAWHCNPGWALAQGKKLSRRVALRHDYLPFEFALFIYVDDRVSSNNSFVALDAGLEAS